MPTSTPGSPRVPLPRLEAGITLFNATRYFEAHEAFEDLWRAENGSARLLWQGTVQACAGLVKHQRGQDGPALTLLRKGLAKLESVTPPPHCGLDVAALIVELRRVLAALEQRREFEPPAIRRSGDL